MTATEVLENAGLNWEDELADTEVAAREGPLPGSRSRTPTGTRRRRSVASKRLEVLQTKLSQEMFQAGAMIGMGLPVTGYYACQESDNFTKAVVQLASKRVEWIEALENLAMIGPGIMVGRTAVGLGAAFAVDRGRADPEKQFMKFLGVYSAWEAVNNPDGSKVEGSAYVPPPSRFSAVS